MTAWDIVGYVAVVANVAGNLLLVGRNPRNGFAVRLVPNALWLAHGIVQRDGSVVLNAVVFAAINTVGVWRNRASAKQQGALARALDLAERFVVATERIADALQAPRASTRQKDA